jgi:hypothetical protein
MYTDCSVYAVLLLSQNTETLSEPLKPLKNVSTTTLKKFVDLYLRLRIPLLNLFIHKVIQYTYIKKTHSICTGKVTVNRVHGIFMD